MYQRDKAELNDLLKIPAFIQDIVRDYPFERLEQLLPPETVRRAHRVVLTGNGDSYAASMALRFFFQKMWNLTDVTAERAIDVSRNLYLSPDEDPSQMLVFIISESGTGARVAEVAERMHRKGCTVVGVTRGVNSNVAQNASCLLLETGPRCWDFHYSSQNFTYTNAMTNLFLAALYGAVVRGVITREREQALRDELLRYTGSFAEKFDCIDEQMYRLALEWADTIGYDFVGSGADIAAAYFGAAKGFEYSGSVNMYSDSEDWNHINFFMRDRAKLGTCVMLSKNSTSYSRTLETVKAMLKSGRRVLVVTEEQPDALPQGAVACTLPDTAETGFKPLMDYIPFTLLAFHIARMRDLSFFVTENGYGTGPLFAEPDMNYIKTSQRIYID